jgi:hypothetical protein
MKVIEAQDRIGEAAAVAPADVIDLQDRADKVRHLVYAIYLAAGSLGDSMQTDAIQEVCLEALKRLEDLADEIGRLALSPEPVEGPKGAGKAVSA